MAIVALKKVTLCGLIADKSQVLDKLQSLGGTHLIPLAGKISHSEVVPAHNIEDALSALKYLQQCPKKRHQVTQSETFNFSSVVQEVVCLKNNIIDLLEQREFLQQRIKDVSLWGDFNLAKEGELQGYKLWFYIVPKRLMKAVRESDLVWERVNQTNTDIYVVVVAKDEPSSKAMPVPRTHVGSLSLSQVHKKFDDTALAIEDAYARREYLSRWMSLIMLNLAAYTNQFELDNAHLLTRDETDIFVVQAWIAAAELARIENFSQFHHLALLIEQPDGVEQPPTLLKNTPTFAGGEEVVKFYQMPNYYSWDPSIIVFFSFALFFAMILSDAGYALLFMGLLILKWKAIGRTTQGIRLRMLLLITFILSVLWGSMVGSYFGFSPSSDQLLGKLHILDMNDSDAMMHISIFVGVMHIALANGVHAYQLRYKTTCYAALGWSLFVVGGFILWLAQTSEHVLLKQTAYGFLATAMLCVVLFSSERKLQSPIDLALRLFDGIKGLLGITKIFGDVLSYMRLFALGLASASLAITFNQLAGHVHQAMPGVGLFFSLLILLLGHALNIILGIMSGVVHGTRLNFIEFYNWSVSDEGYPFKAFSKKRVINE